MPQNSQLKLQNQDLTLDLLVPNPVSNKVQSPSRPPFFLTRHLCKLKRHKAVPRRALVLGLAHDFQVATVRPDNDGYQHHFALLFPAGV